MASCNCGANHHPAPQPDFSKKMQAITAVINPQTLQESKTGNMLLFQSLPNHTLGLEQFEHKENANASAQGQSGKVMGCYDAVPVVPTLALQSNLVSMAYDNLVHVFGVLHHTNSICRLSPVVEPLPNSQVPNGIIAGCSNGDNNGWIYYQKFVGRKLMLVERSLENINSEPVPVNKTDDAMENTQLVAFWDGSHRWIVYQTEDSYGKPSTIKAKCVDRSDGDDIEQSHKFAGGRSKQMAAVHTKAAGNQIYIYFTSGDNEVFRSVANVSGGALQFPQPEALATNLTIAEYASLAVAPHLKHNVIYTVPERNDRITVIKDPLA